MMKKCICNVENEWLETATSLLQENHISPDHFANCVRLLLEKGRGKYRNIMLTGPANCGKTFLLNPLYIVFKTFTNPASTSFAWVGAETRHDLLLMLEGKLVHLPAPKSHYAKDIVFNRDTPVFCTTNTRSCLSGAVMLMRAGLEISVRSRSLTGHCWCFDQQNLIVSVTLSSDNFMQ